MGDLVDKASAWDACQESFKKGRVKGLDEAARVIGAFLTDPLTVHRNPEEVIRDAMRAIREKMNATD